MSVGTVRAVAFGAAIVLFAGISGHAQSPAPGSKVAPKLEPIAETKLIMEGLAHANFRGLERLLTDKPADVQAWTFARGQALLLAETANLLMLRPPKNQGQDAWMRNAADLRETGTELARQSAARDYDKTRAALGELTNTCNRCHQTFQVPVRIGAAEDERKP